MILTSNAVSVVDVHSSGGLAGESTSIEARRLYHNNCCFPDRG